MANWLFNMCNLNSWLSEVFKVYIICCSHIDTEVTDGKASTSTAKENGGEANTLTKEPVGEAGTSTDDMYASWLLDETIEYTCVSSESEIEEQTIEEPTAAFENKQKTLYQILQELAIDINQNNISKFNISRNHVWEGTVRGLTRKSFSPQNKVSVKFCDDIGRPEGAVDQGGPKREFFTLVLEWIINSQIFCGTEKDKFISCNATCHVNDHYFYTGQIIAMSLVHGGPAIRCFSPGLYHSLVYGVRSASIDISDVYDPELRNDLLELINCKSVTDAQNCVAKPSFQTVLDLAGTLKQVKSLDDIQMITNETARWFLLGRVSSSLERLKDGLNVLGVLGAIVDNPDIFRPAFCYVPQTLTVDLLSSLFTSISRSESGSNAYAKESLTLSYWNDYIQDVEEHAVNVSFRDIMFFTSGCKDIPPLGLEMSLAFLNKPESNGLLSKFPKANTCSCTLSLPTTHTTYEEFKNSITFAFLNTKGFDEP